MTHGPKKMYNTLLKQNAHFDKPRMSNKAFIVLHFADKVEYQCEGFLEKNKDIVNEEQINVLKLSKFDLLLELFEEDKTPISTSTKMGRPSQAQREHKKSVGLQFRSSLNLLMETLNATNPHYVRCIKPNDLKAPFTMDNSRAVQQLRACGVLETIRISAAGFPSRWTYQEFFSRYRVLMKLKDVLFDFKRTCQNVLEKLITDHDKYQFGKTKIFFRAGQVAYLEKLRSDKLRATCVRIQKTIRCWLVRKRYLKMRQAAITIQNHSRSYQARRYVLLLRRTRAAVIIQRNVRMWAARRHYLQQQRAALIIQSYLRAYVGRQHYYKLMYEKKALIIQRCARAWLARCRRKHILAAIILLQSCMRRVLAKKELKKLRLEARSVEHFKKLNVGMENKIIQLQRKVDEQLKENRAHTERLSALEKSQAVENEGLGRELERLRGAEEEARVMARKVPSLLEELSFLRRELETTQSGKLDVEEQARLYKERTHQVVEQLNEKNSLLSRERDDLNMLIQEQNQQIAETSLSVERYKQLYSDLTEERSHYQNLLSEHRQLEERYADLKKQTAIHLNTSKPGHKRRDSNYSSNESEYTHSSGFAEGEDSFVHREDVGESVVDMPILLKLQRRVTELEQEKHSLLHQLDKREDAQNEKAKEVEEQRSVGRAELDLEGLKRQELESENKRLKQDLSDLREALSQSGDAAAPPPSPGSLPYDLLLEQLNSSNEELEMRKEEVLLLRSHMVRQEALKHKDSLLGEGLKFDISEIPPLQDLDRSASKVHTLNEDGELWLAYEGLKETNRVLETELQVQGRSHQEESKMLHEEVCKVREENAKLQKLLAQSLILPEGARIEASMQHEITRLTDENLDLLEQQGQQDKTIRKLKRQLKHHLKRLDDYETGIQRESTVPKGVSPLSPVAITRKERDFQGMLEFHSGDESRLTKNLIVDLKPRGVAVNFTPGLPAYILFMCLRHADYTSDDQRVSTLLNSTINSIKGVVKRRGNDFETISFWLANTCRFLHCLRQYSGDEVYMTHNTPKQNEHCLSNFDLSEYQQVISELAIQIYQQLIRCLEEVLQPLIVPAMLEHEPIQGVMGTKPTGLRKRTSSIPGEETVTVDSILQRLSLFHTTMTQHNLDKDIISQVVKQQFYIICAATVNQLLLRKDMCSWSKGLQIRYNVWQLEEWLVERELADCGAKETLEPLVQAAQLLQVKKKTEEDARAICTMCTALTTIQIVKVLNLYTPAIEFEERVSISFIRTIQGLLKGRVESPMLLMDAKKVFIISFPFSPSSLALESIQIPSSLNLSFLIRV